ncbi:MAG: hypothetical protein IMZ61_04665 [Planctomycetes bacterium]|nr:hypothetical protein [Planctomycetota bacterium]
MSSVASLIGQWGKKQVQPWKNDEGDSSFMNIFSNSPLYSGYETYGASQEERKQTIMGEQRADAEAAQKIVQGKADTAAAVAKAAADKIVADKAKADKELQDAADALAKRRRGSSPYSGSQQGVLGQAPVQLKTLLGQ